MALSTVQATARKPSIEFGSNAMTSEKKLYGMIAQFGSAQALLDAVVKARTQGYRKMEAYSPYPIHGLSEALGFHKTKLPYIIFCGGFSGALIGFLMMYTSAVWFYPLNIAGKPYNSWVGFVPITFECMILLAAFSAVLGMLGLNGLPQPYHPLFNSDAFAHASRDKFFLCVESEDPLFSVEQTRQFFETLSPEEIDEVAT
jgi:Protein of unknown function (DUF3341)